MHRLVIIDLDGVLKKLVQSGSHDPQMVDRRNLFLRYRCGQRILAELMPYTEIIFSIGADRVPMAA